MLAKAKATDPESTTASSRPTRPRQYHPSGRYIVIGAGIASINEWANALDAGAKVIALRRNPAPDEQDLNVPRCLFEALGIDIFQGPLRGADRVPRPGAQGHRAQAPLLAASGSRTAATRAASRS